MSPSDARSTIGSMSSAQIAAMAAGQKDLAGPTMLFAQVGSGESAAIGDNDKDEPLSKQQTEDLGSRLQQVWWIHCGPEKIMPTKLYKKNYGRQQLPGGSFASREQHHFVSFSTSRKSLELLDVCACFFLPLALCVRPI